MAMFPLRETGVPLYAAKLDQYGEVKDIPPSSIIRLLGTNSAPPDDQREHVRHLLAEPKEELQAVEEDIIRLQARLADIQHRKRELTSYVEDLGALLSPIRRMPPEIMARIFDFCGDVHVRGPHCEPSRRAPLLLGSVCRSWRALSLALPRLWTALYLELPTSGTFEKQEEILEAWIQRSRPIPIALWLWNDFLTDDVPASFLRRLSLIIQDNADRWRAIFVHFPAATRDWDCFNALVCSALPALEELEISPQCTPWAPFRPELLPQLRELQIPAGAMPDSHRTLPWTQLTQLTLRGGYRPTDVDELLGVLTCAPLLAHLHVEISQYKCESKFEGHARIAMPCLITLVLVTISSHEDCISHLLDALSTPVLRDFQLLTRVWDSSQMTTGWCHESFLGLLVRSACSLNHFTLTAVAISTAELRAVMERCPSLVLLKLNGVDVPRLIAPLLLEMIYEPERERKLALAPWLKAISLSCESMAALDQPIDGTGLTFEQAFAMLVTSRTTRWEPNSRVLKLKWIHWTIWWDWWRYQPPAQPHAHPELERRLSMLCAEEVDVGVSAAIYNKYKRVS